jgi:magnesium and cobalt exporter, CNNM family
MSLSFNFVAIVVLLVLNAFFVAAEFALVKVSRIKVESLAADGGGSARMTLRILNNLEAYLAACQLGITMASLGLGMVGEPFVAALLEPVFTKAGLPKEMLHPASFASGFLIFSSLHIVIGEQVPKTIAIRKPESTSLLSAYALHVAYIAVWPLNWLLNQSAKGILAMMGIKEASHHEVYSNDELKGMVDASREHGEIAQDRATMLKNLFEFDQRQVGRVMIPRSSAATLSLDNSPAENREVIAKAPHSRFPLMSSQVDGEVVGLILVRDVYNALLSGEEEPWKDLERFSRKPLIVPDTQRIPNLFELMRSQRAHMAFVVDEYGAFTGIVTLEDLLEEIVGEIQDETDEDSPDLGLVEVAPGHWEANGLASLGDVERTTGLVVPADVDANTLSGLFLTRLERMPQVGDAIEEGTFKLKVLELSDRHVSRVDLQDTGVNDAPAVDH